MIKFVVDVGLPPAWVDVLAKHGWPAVHWSGVGDPRAKDYVVMAWAREHRHVVFTHDLDFGTLLALTRASGPSVVQVRTQYFRPTLKMSWSARFAATNTSYRRARLSRWTRPVGRCVCCR